jgi:hypothetical protein
MDQVHDLRDNYGADFVSLFVDDGAYCGMGWCSSDASSAFTVVRWDCAADSHSFAHEVGHNQGCAHDRENETPGCALYSYSYGWRFVGNDANEYRTVMAYPPGERIQHFSNPSVSHAGEPTGVSIGDPNEAHNARTINERRFVCEGFRQTHFDAWVDFAYSGTEMGTYGQPFDSVFEGVLYITTGVGASELPNLWIKAGSTSETVTISKAMTIRACGGTVTIGE